MGINLSIPPPSEAYEPYSVANMKVKPHKRHIEPGRWENDLIHCDLQGPFDMSHNDFKVLATFLDNYTLRSAIYCLPNKDDTTALTAFKSFLNQVEHGERKCTRLRSDCGTEFNNYDMYAFRLAKGITWEGNVPGNPQINGKSERLSQTIQRKASAMLQGSQLSIKYWSEFARTTNYLRNRQPVTGHDVTPFEASTGHPPDISHLRILKQTGYCQVHLGNTG